LLKKGVHASYDKAKDNLEKKESGVTADGKSSPTFEHKADSPTSVFLPSELTATKKGVPKPKAEPIIEKPPVVSENIVDHITN